MNDGLLAFVDEYRLVDELVNQTVLFKFLQFRTLLQFRSFYSNKL